MQELLFRSAELSDIGAVVALEEAVERALPHRDMFATDGPDFYVPIVKGAGHILLAEDGRGRLAGVSVIRFPHADDTENLGLELGLSSKELDQVRHLESVFVSPDFQGRGLAEKLIRENMLRTAPAGRPISCATVWPLNFPSLRLHLQLGLVIHAFACKYGGKPRFVLMHSPEQMLTEGPPLFMQADCFDEHRRLLSQGFAGTGCRREEDGRIIVEYRRKIM